MLDALLRTLGLDPAQGLEVLDRRQIGRRRPSGDLPTVILSLSGDLAALQQALLERYPAEYPITLVRAPGDSGQERVETRQLHELEHQEWADYLTSLYLPALGPSALPPADSLVEVMARLRGADGCPWDRAQTHESLRTYMLEEAYEAVEAIDSGDPQWLCEELGDVLLQVVFNAQVAKERGAFDFNDVVEGITAKLVRRHPHIFGDAVAETPEAVTRTWEAVKRAEKGGQEPESVLGKVPMAMPALSRAAVVQKRAAKVGFDWDDLSGPVAKVREELDEVLAAAPADQEGELGDLLFAVVNLARMLKIDPEVALTGTIAKFVRRFRHIERSAAHQGRILADMTLEELDSLWDDAKRAEFGQ